MAYLMQNKTLEFALETGSETVYVSNVTVDSDLETAPAITTGNTYTVIWGGVNYECVAKEYTTSGVTFITLGNLNIHDSAEDDTGEPFVYVYLSENTANFKTLETDASRVISIYDGVLKESRYLMYNQTIEGFVLNENTGLYKQVVSDGRAFSLTLGKKYIVVWDGTVYTCGAVQLEGVSLGNAVLVYGDTATNNGFADTGEPFFITCADANNSVHIFTASTETSHTVSVYELADQSGHLMENRELPVTYSEGLGVSIAMFVSEDGGETWLDPISQTNTQPILSSMPIPGKTYTVKWDGTEYACTTTGSVDSEGYLEVYLGNLAVANPEDGEDTGEPFVVAFRDGYYDMAVTVATKGTAKTHTVSIYAGGYLFKNVELAHNAETKAWMGSSEGSALSLVVGETYTVTVNGTDYVCVAFNDVDGMSYVGNKSPFGGEDTGEPFIFGTMPSGENTTSVLLAWFDDKNPLESCTVSLYEGVKPAEDENATPDTVNLVLLDRNGNPVTYEGIKTVSFNTADGKIATFTLSAISS